MRHCHRQYYTPISRHLRAHYAMPTMPFIRAEIMPNSIISYFLMIIAWESSWRRLRSTSFQFLLTRN
jgi:hypothetical protein